jgi:hypothetical protein
MTRWRLTVLIVGVAIGVMGVAAACSGAPADDAVPAASEAAPGVAPSSGIAPTNAPAAAEANPPAPGSEGLHADAGRDLTIAVGEAPTFDGCGSSGTIANYKWTVVSAPSARSADVGKPIREVDAGCSFTLEESMALDDAGAWVVELEVQGADGQVATDTVTVIVTP